MSEYDSGATASPKSQSLAIPIAIIVGFGFIAAAIYFSGAAAKPSSDRSAAAAASADSETATENTNINPVTENDHILGNPNAPIMIVEYSDFDCPYCKSYHETMQRIMDEYGAGGKVAWVYRHFPLSSLHPSAPHLAEASECVAKLGSNDAFWKFADLVFGERGINDQTNIARLGEFATTAGVDEEEFTQCLSSKEMAPYVAEDLNNALELGARGTPYSVVLIGDQQLVVSGAQPYSVVKQIVDGFLKNIEGDSEEQ